MINKVRIIIKYLIVLIFTILILLLLLIMSVKIIPKEKIEENVIKSANVLDSFVDVKRTSMVNRYGDLHIYADEILLNIIYCMDTNEPLKCILLSRYYENLLGPNLRKAIEEKSNGNTEYMRYWHGSMLIIRPLLSLFDIEQIYYIMAFIVFMLLIIFLISLILKKCYALIIIFMIGIVFTASWYVPFCLEYVWTYLIMFIVTIIAMHIENKNNANEKINMLMFVSGIMTCFFDFLTTEVLTVLIPIICIFYMRCCKHKGNDIYREMKNTFKWLCLWGMGYISMWGVKWLLDAIVLQVNVWDFVKDRAMLRINDGKYGIELLQMINETIKKNFFTLNIVNKVSHATTIKVISVISAFIILGIIYLILKKDKETLNKIFILCFLGTIPYIRYIILPSHSYHHYYFVFRLQLATILSLGLVIYTMLRNAFRYKERKIDGK